LWFLIGTNIKKGLQSKMIHSFFHPKFIH